MSLADRISSLAPEQRALFEKLLAKQQQAVQLLKAPPVPRVSGSTGEGDWPLSFDQERYWFIEQMSPGRAGLNITAATRMRGPVSVPVVAAALSEIVRRHAAWRTAFPVEDGAPVQRVSPPRPQLLSLVDLAGLPEELREAEALRLVGEDAAAPFDLALGPLVRSSLVRMSARDHVCLLTVHHMVTDWISFQIAWGELAALCADLASGRRPTLPEPPVQYPDFAVWQREWLQDEVLSELVAWWRERLDGFPLALELPTDRPRPAMLGMRGGRRAVAVPAALSEGLRSLARREGATLFMAVLAATAALVARDSGQERLILGANNANRNRPEIEPVVGCFLTQVPFAIDLAGDPAFLELLARVRQTALGAYAHQDLPFGKLVEAIQPRRDPSRQPLIQALVQVLDGEYSEAGLSGVTFEAVDAYDGNARYELLLTLFDFPDGISGSLEYDADLFDAATAERRIERLLLQIAAAVADPEVRVSELPVHSEAQRHQVLAEWNDTARPRPGWTLPQRLAARAAQAPDALALVADVAGVGIGGPQVLTYGELNRRAEALARRLRAAGAGPGSRVALLLGPSLEAPLAILATWKAGAACVPLDPAAPAARLGALLADVEPAVLVHSGALPGGLFGVHTLDLAAPPAPVREEDGGAPRGAAGPGDLAYLIFTSGTTGLPKAVMVEHGSLAATLAAVLDRLGLGPDDRMPVVSRYTFDISLLETFAPLAAGGEAEILSEDDVLDPEALAAAAGRATVVHGVPALLRGLAASAAQAGEREPRRFAGLRSVLTGGDAVPPDLQVQILAAFPVASLHVLYGPTEATIICAASRVERGRRPERMPVGRPLPGVELRVVDGRGEPVALGVPGELWIGGPGVARGYFRREELTAERFVERDGRRFYRTGDLVRHVASEGGALEFLGRTDQQVKVRGFRIEPGEIEAALAAHPAVGEAVVVARPDGGGERRLVAYCVPAAGNGAGVPEPRDLRAHLASRLPSYMVPAAFVVLPTLPLTRNGKVDRARLPDPEAPAETGEEAAPATPMEEVVAGIWREVLGLPRVARTAHFFDLGGHSLLATQVASRLRAATGAELPIRILFQSPTVASLAAAVEAELSAGASGTAAPPIRPVPREGNLPLSFAQERLWFLDRLAPGNAAYHIPLALAARGELSLPALEAALGEMVRRHEALRTTFRDRGDGTGRPAQAIAPPIAWRLPLVDLSALRERPRAEEARRIVGSEMVRPFDLERGPVLRNLAVRLGAAEHALLLVVHHVAADAWSLGVMLEEIAALYPVALAARDRSASGVTASPIAGSAASTERPAPAGPAAPAAPAGPAPLPVQYADFAVWQREWLQGKVLERQLAYWRERLAGLPTLDLPTDRPRPATPSLRGATRVGHIDAVSTRALAGLARANDATLFMVLLAAVQALLGRYAGQEDVVVGSPIANRTRAEVEPLIGFFVNTLVLRGDLAGDPPFAEVVARARRAALEAYSHQDVPFERLVEELRPERRPYNPLFQVLFAVQNAPRRGVELPGLGFETVDLEMPATRFDLELLVSESGDGLAVQLTYGTDLFDGATMLRLLGHLDALLAAVAAEPSRRLSRLTLLSPAERHQLVVEWNDTAAEIPRLDIWELFGEQAQRRPDAVAVSSEEGDLTYGELARRAARLARRLVAAGVGPEARVALLAERTPALVAGMLGVLAAGGAYVPLDPTYPAERLAFMLADSGARVLLGERELLATAPAALTRGDGPPIEAVDLSAAIAAVPVASAGPADTGPPPDLAASGPDRLAYVMYTSGSTGRPKGVGVTHRAIVRLVRESGFADLGAEQVFLQLSPFSFDVATLELWAPLLNGGRLALAPPRRTSLEDIGEAIARWRVTTLWLTAGLFHQMVDLRLGDLAPLRQLIAGGDVLSPPHVRRALAGLPGVTLIDGYGPTEVTTFTCCHPMTDPAEVGESVSIGRPIGNTRVHVLGPRLELAPVGVWGELWAGGVGVARGYPGRPDLTAERFGPDPFTDGAVGARHESGGALGARLYRTGDMVRFLADGRIEFRGRADGQVKLRGFRIELGEVESALAAHPEVAQVAVTARDDGGPAGKRLVAYVVPQRAAAEAAPPGRRDRLVDPDERTLTAEAGGPVSAAEAAERRLVTELRRFLAAALPHYMLPSAWVLLDTLPLSPNGKVDRRALPAPERAGEPAAAWVPPSTPLEERLAGVAARVLGRERIGMRDNFFDLGGHSLLATQLVSWLTQEHGIAVTLQAVFDAADMGDLADRIVERELASADAALLDEALREMEDLSPEELEAMLEQGGGAR